MFEGFFITMATNLPSWLLVQCLEQLLKFLVNLTLLRFVKSQSSYGFLVTKELIFGFQILDLKDLNPIWHWRGGMMAPKMFLTTAPKRLGGGSWNLLTFNINLFSIKKVIFGSLGYPALP